MPIISHFPDTVIVLELPIEFALLTHVVGLIFAFLYASSFSLAVPSLKEQRQDSRPCLCGGGRPWRVARTSARGQRWVGAGEAAVILRCWRTVPSESRESAGRR